MEDNKIYKVEALSIFKMTYYIKAKSKEDAMDEFVWEKGKDTFKEGGQEHLDEIISGARELTEEEFLVDFTEINCPNYDCWDKEQKMNMINEIDYEK